MSQLDTVVNPLKSRGAELRSAPGSHASSTKRPWRCRLYPRTSRSYQIAAAWRTTSIRSRSCPAPATCTKWRSAEDRRWEVGPRSVDRVSLFTSDTPGSPFLSSFSRPENPTPLVSVKTCARLGAALVPETPCARVDDRDLSKVCTKRKISCFRPVCCLDHARARRSSISRTTFVYPEETFYSGGASGHTAQRALNRHRPRSSKPARACLRSSHPRRTPVRTTAVDCLFANVVPTGRTILNSCEHKYLGFLTQMYARFWGGLADPGVGLTAGISQKPPGFRGFCS